MPRTGVLGASDELRERARAILTRNASLTAKESLTVVTDDATREVGELFYAAGCELGATTTLLVMPEGRVAGVALT